MQQQQFSRTAAETQDDNQARKEKHDGCSPSATKEGPGPIGALLGAWVARPFKQFLDLMLQSSPLSWILFFGESKDWL